MPASRISSDVDANKQCAEDQRCLYDEPEAEAITEIRREVFTEEEYEARTNPLVDGDLILADVEPEPPEEL